MFFRPRARGRGPLFSSFLCLALGFAVIVGGCDKAPSKKGPEKGAGASSEVQRKEVPPPTPESHDEPESEAQSEGQVEGQAALESALPSPHFDEGTSPEFRKAFSTFEKWVQERGGSLHVALVDLETDKWLVRAASNTPVNPASNAKILTAAAALELLGPAYQFKTELLGSVDEKGISPRLVLRGGGAPDLTTADLYRLVRVAKGQGLSKVEAIVVDQSRFDDRFVPPAFEQQPNEWAPFRAPVSALALNENSISLNVVPTSGGESARVWYDPPGVVIEEGRIETVGGADDRVTWNLEIDADPKRPKSRVGGSVGAELSRRRYARRLEDPRLAGGYALAALLQEAGVEVAPKVSLGKAGDEPRIAVWYSEPLAELLRALGKDSNNFFAEMIFVALSQADGEENESLPWSSARGAKSVVNWLENKKIETKGLVVKNGSGLFDANQMSAELLTSVLASIEDNPRVYQDFVSHLAMGATDGTMKNRMTRSDIGQRIRAKTGTLRDVDALTGYIQRPGGKSPAAFSVIVRKVRASHAEVRNRVDRLVVEWQKSL